MGRMPTHVVGVDSSTQATKVVVVDPADGSVVREARRAHPEGTEVDPRAWWTALSEALGEVGTDDVGAIAVAGQQHGMVLCDAGGEPVRDALLWNDTRSADAAHDLVDELGGPAGLGGRRGHRPRREHHRHASCAGPRATSPTSPRPPGRCCSPTTG